MTRAPYQVPVFLRRCSGTRREYLLLLRSDMNVWQGIAGGGEDSESPMEAALRETREETGIVPGSMLQLSSSTMLPAKCVLAVPPWPEEEIPEYSFIGDVPTDTDVQLSAAHSDFRWCDYETSVSMLEWESMIISRRKHRPFRVLRSGAHAVCVSRVPRVPYRYLFSASSFLTLTSPRSMRIAPCTKRSTIASACTPPPSLPCHSAGVYCVHSTVDLVA
ncbi:NUDIX pyrophosphatase [Coriobacteriales bacterium OH1046]|nr:NUDIX pyrophosphatase [Coriobacteriales bacterium OH1046]